MINILPERISYFLNGFVHGIFQNDYRFFQEDFTVHTAHTAALLAAQDNDDVITNQFDYNLTTAL